MGAKPFLELSFMPAALAANPQETITYYRGITSPPSSYRRWADADRKDRPLPGRHLWIEGARAAGISKSGTNRTSPSGPGHRLNISNSIVAAVLAIKKVDPLLKVGGPSTARAAWVADLLAYCASSRTPVDFISTHIYPSDVPFMEEAHGEVTVARTGLPARSFRAHPPRGGRRRLSRAGDLGRMEFLRGPARREPRRRPTTPPSSRAPWPAWRCTLTAASSGISPTSTKR